jgi:hypothetical protein
MFLGILFVMAGCGKKKSDSIYDIAEDEGKEEIRGTIYTRCYPDKTCDEDLICDKRYDICIRDCSKGGGFPEEPDDDTPSACNPNPCPSIANATGICTITEDETDFECECKTNYTWNSQTKTCDADSRNNYCNNLPSYAKWNTVSQITQVWNGETWVPDNTGVYDTTPSTTECHFVCNENYDWNGTSCSGVKKTENCTGLPENASWNTVSSITQTWNGYSWTPDTKGYYNISPSTSQCRFKCNEGHYYHDDKCVTPCTEGICNIANSTGLCKALNWDKYSCECEENYTWNDSTLTCDANTKVSQCIGLAENAAWNIVANVTQTWNGTEWLPTNESIYSETSSTTECRYKCKTNYSWENSVCVPSSRISECTGLPVHAFWNNGSTVSQTWTGSVWSPSTLGTYNKNPGATPCTFQCDEDFHWENPYCISDKKTVSCTGILPENAVWNTTSSITQTWKNNAWTPDTTGKFNASPSTSECRFKCKDNYFWDGTRCIADQCNPKTCDRDSRPHLTGECISKGANKQTCVCEEGFYWWDDIGCTDKKPLSLGNICTGQNKCYNNSAEISCPAEGEDFYGQDAQYAALGKCTPKSFRLRTVAGQNIIVDNNTGLEWQQAAPSQKYTWENARDYCSGLVYGGHTGWRLPAPHEFLTIIDSSKRNLALNGEYFTNMPSDQLARMWTSKEASEDPDTAITADVYYGSIHRDEEYLKINQYNVICVWGDELPTGSFTTSTLGDDDDDVVIDSVTGLMWQKTIETKTWQEALEYCEDLEYAGYSDWRLPNRNELASLVKFDLYQPASDFPDMPEDDHFWTSSYLPTTPTSGVTLDSITGTFGLGNLKTFSKSVRCVRNSN